ncbi:MAG: hypothetical protein RBT41_00735 [Clostridia bacterium]|jgi:hypothetical protein|nr:hypothetical protein [Clostridia bacterium]
MKNNSTVLIVFLLALLLLAPGCTNNAAPPQEPPVTSGTPGTIADVFPLTQGSTWEYHGVGNEFAAFKQEVVFAEGKKGQIRKDNGGTVSAAVFEISDDAVTRVFFQGESYEDENFLEEESAEKVIVIKAPLEAGTTWEEPNGTRKIISVNETVTTPAGEFKDCLKIEVANGNSTIYEYYKAGVGLIMSQFSSNEAPDEKITSLLESYDIK